MKIIHTVESYLPARHGMAEVVRQLSERLAARGHDVTVATSRDSRRTSQYINGVRIAEFSVGGKLPVGIWGDCTSYQEFLKSTNADVIVNFAAQQWATDLMMPILDQIPCAKILVPTGFSGLNDPIFADYFKCMPGWMNKYDACVYLSQTYRDLAWARAAGLTNEVHIPNGASAEEFDCPPDHHWRQRHGINKDELLILHVAGYLSPEKGQLDAVQIVDSAHLRNATLLIVCPEFSQSILKSFGWRWLAKWICSLFRGQLKSIVPVRIALAIRQLQNRNKDTPLLCIALNRQEMVQAFLSADLLLFPSHLECSPLVLFEAAASGTPFLATPAGNTEEIAEWLGNGIVLPSRENNDQSGKVKAIIQDSAIVLSELAMNAQRRCRLASTGLANWRAGYTWECITDKYENLYGRVIRGGQ